MERNMGRIVNDRRGWAKRLPKNCSPIVILSAAKNLVGAIEILRCAQNDGRRKIQSHSVTAAKGVGLTRFQLAQSAAAL